MDQEFRHMCELLAMDDQPVCSHCGMKFDTPAEGEPFCCYECQEAAREVELEGLRKDRARLDWLLRDLECSRIGGSDDLDVLACERASVENPDMWDGNDEDYWRHYLVVCREAIDVAMKKEE